MNNKTLALLGTTVLTSLISGQSHAGTGNSFTDYGKVMHVEPLYKYVTVQKPERRCEIVRPTNRTSNRYSNGHNNNQNAQNVVLHNSSRQGQSPRTHNTTHYSNGNTGSAAIIGAVIGGAIGHHVTNNVTGRGNVGGTLVGAAIGSTIAQNAARNQTTTQRNNSANYRTSHSNSHSTSNHQNNNSRNSNRHQSQGVERCYTTTVSHEERRQNGYNVTYRYQGQTFSTKTSTDPGQRIAVTVQIKPH